MAYLVQRSDKNTQISSSYRSRVPDNDCDLYREAVDFADMKQLLSEDAKSSGFRLIARDAARDISLFSRPVDDCPMHLMRAEAVLPCLPAKLLAYLHVSMRRRWDDYIAELRYTRTLPRPPDMQSDKVVDVDNEALLYLQPGQRRVAVHYMAIRSPIPLVQNRDFELVVAEEVCHDGTAWLRAFSTPLGYVEPLDPRQSKYVRALLLFSGILARPICGADGRKGCRMSYVALVHPMGLTPSVIVNLVLSAQLKVLRKLQRFILEHPLDMPPVPNKACAISSVDNGTVKAGNETETTARPSAEEPAGASAVGVDGADDNNNKKKSGSVDDDDSRSRMTTTKRRARSAVRNRLSSLKARVIDGLMSQL